MSSSLLQESTQFPQFLLAIPLSFVVVCCHVAEAPITFADAFPLQDMPTYDQIFSTVEDYKGLNIQYLSVCLRDVPRES